MTAYAILVAISRYPGLTNLNGPENDVDALCSWLTSQEAGCLILGEANEFPNPDTCTIRQIRSSDFPEADNPLHAQPAEIAFIDSLHRLLFEGGKFRERIGERLYLYFAGHGFAGQGLTRSALYTAQAQRYDPINIASTSYAELIVKSNAFDEVVLIMDCCRDVDLFDSISKPTLRLPDRQGQAAAVRFLQAYGAGRGEQARERLIDGKVRGLFTHAVLDALRNADVDANGQLTGALFKDYILDTWGSLFEGREPYTPDIHLPARRDIILAKRGARKLNVEIILSPPPPARRDVVVMNTMSQEIARIPTDGEAVLAQLTDGYYKVVLEDTHRSVLIEVSGVDSRVSL